MSRRARLVLFAGVTSAFAVLFVLAVRGLPGFGSEFHPYGDRAVAVSTTQRMTANVVSSVNFDQRAMDTLGEEFILFGSVIGTLVLLRPAPGEREASLRSAGQVLPATRLAGYLLLPVSVLVGLYVIAHGQLSPGGGFQGGVVLATGWHLLYVAGRYTALRRAAPPAVLEVIESLAVVAFAAVGLAGLVLGGALLANVLPTGSLGELLSGGTVPVINAAVGVAVAAAVVLLLAGFLEQASSCGAQITRASRELAALPGGRLAVPRRLLRPGHQPQPGARGGVPERRPVRYLRAAARRRLPGWRHRTGVQRRPGRYPGRRPGGAGADAHRHRGVRDGHRGAARTHHPDLQAARHGGPRRAPRAAELDRCLPSSRRCLRWWWRCRC
jgi:multicomponent Na+:H+ antiporter subunit B